MVGGQLGRPVLVHMHIPKTGGGSVDRGLKRIFGDGLLRLSGLGDPARPPDAEAITGNFRLSEFDEHVAPRIHRPIALIATFRDPVDRLRSFYVHVRRFSTSEQRANKLGVDYDDDINVVVDRWLKSKSLNRHGRRQCKFLCMEGDAETAIRALQDRFLAAATTPNVNLLLAALAGASASALPEAIHVHVSRSTRIPIDPVLESLLRDRCKEDEELLQWVRANESAMLERARMFGRLAKEAAPLPL